MKSSMKKKLVILILMIANTSFGQDIFLTFSDGNSAVLYEEAGQVVFKLCSPTTKTYDKTCEEHFLKITRSLRYVDYSDDIYSVLKITPPFNNASAAAVIQKELISLKSGNSNNEISEQVEKRESFLNRVLNYVNNADEILNQFDPKKSSKVLFVNESSRPELFDRVMSPIRHRFAEIKLPSLQGAAPRYKLDVNSGLIWLKLDQQMTWYEAMGIEVPGIPYTSQRRGCESTLGASWQLPTTMMVRKNLIGVRGVMTQSTTKENRNNLGIVFCTAHLKEAFPDEDYDGDGVKNSLDKCHRLAYGKTVDLYGCEAGQPLDKWNNDLFSAEADEYYSNPFPSDYYLDVSNGKIWTYLGLRNWYNANDRSTGSTGDERTGCRSEFNAKWKAPGLSDLQDIARNDLIKKIKVTRGGGSDFWTNEQGQSSSSSYALKRDYGVFFQYTGREFRDVLGSSFKPRRIATTYAHAVCWANLLEIHPHLDYDLDGVDNNVDGCHSFTNKPSTINEKGCAVDQKYDSWGAGRKYSGQGATAGKTYGQPVQQHYVQPSQQYTQPTQQYTQPAQQYYHRPSSGSSSGSRRKPKFGWR